jgi:hypothetical protein
MPDTPTEIKYRATVAAHWPTGPVPCCVKHAGGLVRVGRAMGVHVAVTPLAVPVECANCVNEAKAQEQRDAA